eukprot:scaffold7199_cov444-Prasinococcus_capsulatus_cf.AAC.2
MACIFATWPVSQADMLWLKADASRNIPFISVTWLVSQADMSWLNADAPENIHDISVTWLVSQSVIGRFPAAPQSTAGEAQSQAPVLSSARQLSTAVFKAAPSANGAASTGRVGVKRRAQLTIVTNGKCSVASLGFKSLRRHAGRGPAVASISIFSAAARGALRVFWTGRSGLHVLHSSMHTCVASSIYTHPCWHRPPPLGLGALQP